MNYIKIKPIESVLYNEFPDMKFGESEKELVYMDFTEYVERHGNSEVHTIEDFKRQMKVFIRSILEEYDITLDELIVCNQDNQHIMINTLLVLVLLLYIDDYFPTFIIKRMHELFVDGFTVSDHNLQKLYTSRYGEE